MEPRPGVVSRMTEIAVIGCGQWGLNHIRVFNSLKGAHLAEVVDTDPKRLARVEEQFPGVRCGQSYAGILQNPQIEAVVVSTPAGQHFSIVKQCLEAGKHVLCEKPLCLRVAEATEIDELARARKRVLMVGHVFLFNPGIVKMKELIQEGAVGRPYFLAATRTNLGPIRNDVNAAFDLASHDISIFNWLLEEEPEAVWAAGSAFLQPGIEDAVFITLRYPSKALANIVVSWLSPKKIRQITIVGSQRMVTWDDLELSNPVTVYDKGAGASREYAEYGEFLRISMWDGDVRMPKVHIEEPLKLQNQSFLHAVAAGHVERSGSRFGLGVVKVLEEISRCVRNTAGAAAQGA